MTTGQKKHRHPFISKKSFLLLLPVFLSITGVSFAQNDIDAVSSASGRLNIKGGKAYATYAEIIWQDYYSNGDIHELRWGKTAEFGNNMDLKPFTRRTDVTTKIEGLEEDTKYYAEIYREFQRENAYVSTKFEFTTSSSSAVVPAFKKGVSEFSSKTHIVLYSISGKKIAAAAYRNRSVITTFNGNVAPGLYIARIVDEANRQVRSFQCMIGN